MVRVPTPAPESTVEKIQCVIGGRRADTIWAIFVTLVLTAIGVFLLVSGGVVGAAVGAIAIGSIYNDTVRAAIRDIYARNFWVWSTA